MSTLVSTDFTGTNGAAWPSPWIKGNGTLTIQSNRGQQVTPAVQWNDANAYAGQSLGDGRVTATIRFPAATGATQRVNARFNTATGNGYGFYLTPEWAQVQVVKITAWSETVLQQVDGVTLTANTDYRVAFDLTGSTIKAKWWPAASAEPATWNVTVTDTTYTSGDVRLVTVATAAAAATGLWDDVLIESGAAPAFTLPALSQADKGRVGFHNDAFLAPYADYGTYTTFTSMDETGTRAYVAGQAGTIPNGGESAVGNPPHSDFPGASADLTAYRWTFLNPEYHADVLNSWTQANKDEIAQRLGYRLRLTTATLPATGAAGAGLPVTFAVANDGYSQPWRARPVQIVFKSAANTYTRTLAADLRTWAPGATTTVTETVTAPPVAGTYAMYLNLPDANAARSADPAYSIQLANTGVWQAATGWNDLGASVTIT